MTLLLTVLVILAGQPQPVLMDTIDLGPVSPEACREHGHETAAALMALHPQCQAQRCFALLRCKGDGGPEGDPDDGSEGGEMPPAPGGVSA